MYGTMNNTKSLPRIVFFGTPEFARYCLAYLVEKGFEIAAVVTAPDRKAGRGKKMTSSPVKTYSIEKGIPVLQPENLKDNRFVSDLKTLAPDLQVVVAFRMLPKLVWEIPVLGTLNLHASLLPNYRGAAPINWAIIEGENETGVTTFLINEQIDTGALLLQERIPLLETYNAQGLHDALLQIGAPLLAKTLINLSEGSLIPKPQHPQGNEKKAPKLTPENTKLDLNQPLNQMVSKIRGLDPNPGAWLSFKEGEETVRMKVFQAEAVYEKNTSPLHHLIVKEDALLIVVRDGYLKCLEIQLPNKRRMPAKDLLNGYTFPKNCLIF